MTEEEEKRAERRLVKAARETDTRALKRELDALNENGRLTMFLNKSMAILRGDTLLHYAARTNAHGVAKLLVSFDASTERRNVAGKTPADVARECGHPDMVKLIAFSSVHRTLRATSRRNRLSFKTTLMGADPTTATLPASLRRLGHLRLREMEASCSKRHAKKGETIIREGDPSDGIMILIKGDVEIMSSSHVKTAILHPVSLFGVFGPFFSRKRSNNVVAATDVTYLHLSMRCMDQLNVQWNGALQQCLQSISDAGVDRKMKWTTRRNERQLRTQFLNCGLANATVLKRRRPTLPAAMNQERERMEDEAIRLHSGRAFGAVPAAPVLNRVLTQEMDDLAKTVGMKCNMAYFAGLQSAKNKNRAAFRRGQINAAEFKVRVCVCASREGGALTRRRRRRRTPAPQHRVGQRVQRL